MTVRNPKQEYGPKYPGIPAALVASDSTVVTIRSFQDIPLRGRRQLIIEFAEMPEHYLYATLDEVELLCAKVNPDDAVWVGAKIPLVKEFVPSKRQGKDVKVWKIPTKPGLWDSVMNQFKQTTRPEGRGSRR